MRAARLAILVGILGAGAGPVAAVQAAGLPTEKQYKAALETLNSKPDDPAANLTAGKYKTWVEADYQFGLPYLAKGSDKTLQTLAQHELDPRFVDTPEKKLAMGDEWLGASKKFASLAPQFYDRAGDWYSQAWAGLGEKEKVKLREVARRMTSSRPPGPPRKTFPPAWAQGVGVLVDGGVARTGSYSMRLPDKDPKAPPPEIIFYSDNIPVAGKKVLELSAYVSTEFNENPSDCIFVQIFDSGGVGVGTWASVVPLDTPFWRKYTVKKDIPEHIVFVRVGAAKRSKSGTLWVDDFSVKLDGVEVLKNRSFEER
jgi:hypothetical protein